MIPTSLKNITYLIAAVLGITYDMAVAFGLLLLIDFVTGITASVFARGWHSFKSQTMWRGIFAKSFVVFALFSISFMSTILGQDMRLFLRSALSILTVAEVYSIWANVYMIKTGKIVEEIDALTPIMNKAKRIFDAIVSEK